MTDFEKLRGFAQRIIACWPDGDVDGGDLQGAAVEFQLLNPIMVTEACGEACRCADYGDFPQTCYRKTTLLTGNEKP